MDKTATQLDPSIVALTKAIGHQESGGDYNKIGDNGHSVGAYQWNNPTPLQKGQIPKNFSSFASEVGDDPNDFSPENQDRVAYNTVKKWGSQGLTPAQIASKWNSGSPDTYKTAKPGYNAEQGVNYDVKSYVNNVAKYYDEFNQNKTPSNNPIQNQPQNNQIVTPQNNPLTSSQPQQNAQPEQKKGLLGNIWSGLVNATAGATENTGRNISAYGGAAVAKSLDALAGIVTGKGAGGITGKSYQDYVNQIAGNDNNGKINDSITQRLGGDNQRLATTPEQFAGDLVQTATLAIPGAQTKGLSGLAKIKPLAKTGSIIGATQGAGNAMSQDGSFGDVLKQTAVGGLTGGVLGVATAPLVKNAPKTLKEVEEAVGSFLTNVEKTTSSAKSVKILADDLNSNSYLYGGKNGYKGIQDFANKESLNEGVPLFQLDDLGNGRQTVNTKESQEIFKNLAEKQTKLNDSIIENKATQDFINFGDLQDVHQGLINKIETNPRLDPVTKDQILDKINDEIALTVKSYQKRGISTAELNVKDFNNLKRRMNNLYKDDPTTVSQEANKVIRQQYKEMVEKMIPDINIEELNKQIMRYYDAISYLEKLNTISIGNNLGNQTNRLLKDYVAGKFAKGIANIVTGGTGGDLIEGLANIGMNKLQNRAAKNSTRFPLKTNELESSIGNFTNPENIKAKGILNQNPVSQRSITQNNNQPANNPNINISRIIPQSKKIVKGLLKRGVNNSIINKTADTSSPIKK